MKTWFYIIVPSSLLLFSRSDELCHPLLRAVVRDIRINELAEFAANINDHNYVVSSSDWTSKIWKSGSGCLTEEYPNETSTGVLLNATGNVEIIPQQGVGLQVRYGMPHDLAASTSDCANNWTHKGWDADIVYTLAAHTGTLDGCVRVDRAEVYPNGTHVGGMLNVTRGQVDIYGASRYHEHSLGDLVSYLYPHRQENICVAVKRLAIDQQVSLPSFSGNIWAATVSILLLFFVVLQLGLGVGFVPAVFAIVHTFVLGGFDSRHGRVMIWLSAFSFVMMNFLSGSLVGSLVSPDRESEIDSLEEVDARHQVVYATPVAAETVYHFTQEDSPTVFSLGQKVRVVKYAHERRKALYEIATFGTAAVVSGSIGLDSLTREPVTIRDGYSLLHRVKECVVAPAYYAFHVRRGWPLIGRFSELLQRMVQGGIITKMFAKNLDLIIQDYHTLPLLPGLPSAPYQPLALLLLSPLFVFWVGNLVFALLVFVLEICLSCYCKRRAKKVPQE